MSFRALRLIRYNSRMHVVCLVMDHLHAGYLGAYGNSWIATPQFDRLAGESLLFDQAYIDHANLARQYQAFWQGWPGAQPHPPAADRPDLFSLLGGRGIQSLLISDEPEIIEHPLAQRAARFVELPRPAPGVTAESMDQTHLAICFMELIDRLQQLQRPTLVWCHLASLGRVWDAPLEFRQQFVEEGDPEPTHSAIVPCRPLPPDVDPDEVLRESQAYAAQIVLWDQCLGALLESLDDVGNEPPLLVVCGARGLPLGEHGQLGPAELPLHSPLVQTPWLIRLPQKAAVPERTQALVQSSDLFATLLEGFEVPPPNAATARQSLLPLARDEAVTARDRLLVAGPNGQWGLRTPAWYLLHTAESTQLYVKPDDRWEANDVAARCQRAIEALHPLADNYRAALANGTPADLAALDEVSLHGLE